MLVFAGVAVAGATGAFFSDTETSTGNTFTAGAIDLKIDNESYVTNMDGDLVASPATSWGIDEDMGLFFNFLDIKPGDRGEDTISIHVNNNDAYACMAIDITATPDNECTEPEGEVDDSCAVETDGELQDELQFAFWNDDGDNVYEGPDGGEYIFMGQGSAATLFDGSYIALADSQYNVWTQTGGPIAGGDNNEPVHYIAKYWCLGDMAEAAVTQDNEGKTGQNGPLDRGTGFTCSGANTTNLTQTDGMEVDVEFYAVQSRNNGDFVCSSMNPRDITSVEGETWASSVGSFDESWQADARYGDGGTTAAQNEIRIGLPGGGSPIAQTHTDNATGLWRSGVTEDFTLTYDGAGNATFTVGDKSVNAVTTVPAVDGSNLGLTLKVNSDAPDASLVLANVQLDGMSPVGPDSTSASGAGDKGSLVISGDTQLADGFTLTGQVTATWSTTPTGSGGEQFGLLVQVD